MKKKVLMVNKMYSPDIGGVETIVKQYAEFLRDSFDVTVLTISGKKCYQTKIEQIENVKVIRCSSFGTYFSMPISFSFFFKLLILKNKFDIIHFHEPFPLASLLGILRKNTKYVITWHSDIIKQKYLKRIVELFQRKLCSKADVILVTSPNLVAFSDVLSDFKGKIKILPLSVNLTEYDESSMRFDEDFALYIGRLSYYKGISFLLEAYEKSNTDLPLYIVGDGDPAIKSEINEFIKNSAKKIVFVNRFVTEREKRDYLQNCKYLLFPSIYPSEAFGIIQLEAMVYGKPVINTTLPTGVPWVSLNKITGVSVTPQNVSELTKAIEYLSTSEDILKSYGCAAKARVNDMFSDTVVLKQLKAIYKEL